METSGSKVLHSTTVSQWHLVFTSDNCWYLTPELRDYWWHFFSFELWEILFLPTMGFELRIYGSQVLHSPTVPQQHLVFTSDNFRYSTLVQWDYWWGCLSFNLWKIFFLSTLGFQLGTSWSYGLHSTTVWGWLLVFTSDNFRYLTLVQRG